MTIQFTPDEFDCWAAGYDQETSLAQGYPFEGYHQVLGRVVDLCQPRTGQHVLDLGCGTGNLAARFLPFGCRVTGIDFSEQMIAIARQKFPTLQLQVQDVRSVLGGHLVPAFDTIVSAYVFHHFPLDQKLAIIQRLLTQHLKPGGHLVIADLIFTDQASRTETARAYPSAWEEEYFWMQDHDLPFMQAAGFQVELERISFCAGILHFHPSLQNR